jgi:hypothetical protein
MVFPWYCTSRVACTTNGAAAHYRTKAAYHPLLCYEPLMGAVSIASDKFASLTTDEVLFAGFLLEAYPGAAWAVLGDATPAIQTLRIYPKFFMIPACTPRSLRKASKTIHDQRDKITEPQYQKDYRTKNT